MAQPLYLGEEEHRLVSDAVSAAEAHTSGEIVTVIAERSDGYTDIALAWSILVAFTALAVVAAIPDFYLGLVERVFDLWGHRWTEREVLTLALGIGVVKFISMMLLQLIRPLKFFLIPGPIKTRRVHERATGFFRVGAEQRTVGSTGILVYLSMREHRAEILADRAIAEKVPPETWGEAMAVLLAEIREGRVAEGMAAAVAEVGKVLAEHCPRLEDDRNELPDRLIEV